MHTANRPSPWIAHATAAIDNMASYTIDDMTPIHSQQGILEDPDSSKCFVGQPPEDCQAHHSTADCICCHLEELHA